MPIFKFLKFYFIFVILIFIDLNADEKSIERAFRVLKALPEWDGLSVCIHQVEGGWTNTNYKAHVGLKDYFVRCGNSHNDLLGISLDKEWMSTVITSAAGLAPQTILYNPEEKVFITNFIDTGHRTVDLRDPISQQKFCALVRSLHSMNTEFPIHFCHFDYIRRYIENAQSVGVELPQIFFSKILPWINQYKEKVSPLSKCVPCHFDLYHGNVLDDGERFWLIDWEYAGMGDPYFDLASLASNEFFSNKEMIDLLEMYFDGRHPTEEEISYFYSMRILADVRWFLWCYLQSKISILIDKPFIPYGDFFLQNALHRLETEKAKELTRLTFH